MCVYGVFSRAPRCVCTVLRTWYHACITPTMKRGTYKHLGQPRRPCFFTRLYFAVENYSRLHTSYISKHSCPIFPLPPPPSILNLVAYIALGHGHLWPDQPIKIAYRFYAIPCDIDGAFSQPLLRHYMVHQRNTWYETVNMVIVALGVRFNVVRVEKYLDVFLKKQVACTLHVFLFPSLLSLTFGVRCFGR